jgi:hypothetical protein
MGIRELQAKQAKLLEEYHEANSLLEDQINELRNKRGTKLKAYPHDGYEAGRSATRTNGNW